VLCISNVDMTKGLFWYCKRPLILPSYHKHLFHFYLGLYHLFKDSAKILKKHRIN
jgi:hypothetical protein